MLPGSGPRSEIEIGSHAKIQVAIWFQTKKYRHSVRKLAISGLVQFMEVECQANSQSPQSKFSAQQYR